MCTHFHGVPLPRSGYGKLFFLRWVPLGLCQKSGEHSLNCDRGQVEIADQLQISSHAARVRFSRALEHLRTELNRRNPKGLKGFLCASLEEKAKTRAKKRLL